jgi:hypothetical protein
MTNSSLLIQGCCHRLHTTLLHLYFVLLSPLYDRKEKITQEKRKDAIDLGGLDGIVRRIGYVAKVDCKRGGGNRVSRPRRRDETSNQEGGRLGGLEAHLQYSEHIASACGWTVRKGAVLQGIRPVCFDIFGRAISYAHSESQ